MPQPAPKNFLKDASTDGTELPSRILLYGIEGIGKSSFPAWAPNPLYLMSAGETGITTLISQKRVPPVSHMPEIVVWPDLIGTIRSLIREDHNYQCLVLDTLNGFERLCFEYVCKKDYNNDWSEAGFTAFQRGYDTSVPEWKSFLVELDILRAKKKMSIVGLAHSKVGPFKNPEGPDYDKYTPDMHQKLWGVTSRWADMVLFANFATAVKQVNSKGTKGKAIGGRERQMHTENHAAYTAKNRHGLPPTISMGDSGQEAWNNLKQAVLAAKEGSQC